LLSAVTTQPIFKALTHYANPTLERFIEKTDVVVTARDCHFLLFADAKTDCDKIKGYLTDLGVQYQATEATTGDAAVQVGSQVIDGFKPDAIKQALVSAGWPQTADLSQVNRPAVFLLMFVLVLYLCMVYGPMAAFMVELFPARIRYTSLSFPFHIGSGWVGGMLSFVVSAMNVYKGSLYYGLWYPVIVSSIAFLVALFFMPETRGRNIEA
jgi:hypothetical protein